ncbi:hypothetical protein JCM10207_002431 [Rhodosporidiobolus poonsookiae]
MLLRHCLPRSTPHPALPRSLPRLRSSPPTRSLSSPSIAPYALPQAQRAFLYVPGSSPPARLQKCLDNGLAGESGTGQPDVLILDLEDSVRTEKKGEARKQVRQALDAAPADCRSRKYVRINSLQQGLDDLEAILPSPHLDGLVLPKVHTAEDLLAVDRFVEQFAPPATRERLRIVASIESPLGLLNVREIATASRRVGALLFAAEDYCASSSLLRTPSRTELLFARSSVVTVARAYGLGAVDLVCVQYKGDAALEVLRDEAEEGRRMGFSGKQVIHPGQVETVQRAFSPSEAEIDRARRILAEYEAARASGAGAYGLEDKAGGGTVMIDAPMLLQAEAILAQARTAGIEV